MMRNPVEQWIIDRAGGGSFVDIGGIGVNSVNERVTLAAKAGATKYTMADIRPSTYHEWVTFRRICREKGVEGVEEVDRVDIRNRADLIERIGLRYLVHSTGINYHLPSPGDAIWNLRSITSRYLITNTVTFPQRVENEFGTIALPDCGVLFTAAITNQDRRVLNKYYQDKFGWDMDYAAPQPGTDSSFGMNWVENGELCCWPYWYLYTDHAFRSLLAVCKLRIIDEWKWQDHALAVICEPI